MADNFFIPEMVKSIKDSDFASASVRLHEEIASKTDLQVTNEIKDLNSVLASAGLPSLTINAKINSGIEDISIKSSVFSSKRLYTKPQMIEEPLKDKHLNRLSEHLEAVSQTQDQLQFAFRPIHIKRTAEFLRDESFKLAPEEQRLVLTRAANESFNRRARHGFNPVFADLDGDGKANELSDLSINIYNLYFRAAGGSDSYQRVDIYDPPANIGLPLSPKTKR
ncbi:MAG: hypothetical protein K2X27_10565 [Candidatus Obscuribacterales bacterium]|nr:hypothetical protein [Candidatus Obscuribacterales bacterium]